jgi:nucleotidyltransferase/DNA polymerase involved in DNA repair
MVSPIRVRYISRYHVRSSPSFSSHTPFATEVMGRCEQRGLFPSRPGTATKVASNIRQQIREELNLTASACVAPNKFLAKMPPIGAIRMVCS